MLAPRAAFLLAFATLLSLSVPVSRAAEVHRYLPEDTEMVVAINFKQILASKLGKDHLVDAIKTALAGSEDAQAILKDLGFDPVKHLHRVLMASPGATEVDRGLVILQGEFDPVKFQAKGEELLKKHGDFFKAHKVVDGVGGQQVIYEVTLTGQQFPWFVCVPAKDAILLSPGKDYIVDALKRNPIKNPLALKNKVFQDLLEKVDDKQSLYLAGTAEALGRLGLPDGFTKDFLKRMDAIAGGLTLDEDLHLEVVLGAKTVNDAKSMHKSINDAHTQGLLLLGVLGQANPDLGGAVEVLKTVRLSQKETSVGIKARIDAELLEKLLSGIK